MPLDVDFIFVPLTGRAGPFRREDLTWFVVNGTRTLNREAIRSCQFIDLHFETKMYSNVGRVVVPFAVKVWEADEHARIVFVVELLPFKLEYLIGRHGLGVPE